MTSSHQFLWVDKFPPSNCSEVLGSGVEALPLPSTSWKEKVSCWSVSLSLYWCCQLPCAKQDLPTLLWRGNASSCLEQSLNSKACEILFTSQMSFKHWHRLKRRLSTEIHADICILWARFQARSRSDWEQHECRPQTYPGLRLADPRSGPTFLCHSNTQKDYFARFLLTLLKEMWGLGYHELSIHSFLLVCARALNVRREQNLTGLFRSQLPLIQESTSPWLCFPRRSEE